MNTRAKGDWNVGVTTATNNGGQGTRINYYKLPYSRGKYTIKELEALDHIIFRFGPIVDEEHRAKAIARWRHKFPNQQREQEHFA